MDDQTRSEWLKFKRRQSYQRNRKKRIAYQIRKNKENGEKFQKEWRARNRKKLDAYTIAWQRLNKDWVNARRRALYHRKKNVLE